MSKQGFFALMPAPGPLNNDPPPDREERWRCIPKGSGIPALPMNRMRTHPKKGQGLHKEDGVFNKTGNQ